MVWYDRAMNPHHEQTGVQDAHTPVAARMASADAESSIHPRGVDPTATTAGATEPDSVDPRTNRSRSSWLWLLAILIGGIALRVWVVSYGRIGHLPDVNTFLRWVRGLADLGLGDFYAAGSFCDYPPLAMLILLSVGWVAAAFDGVLANDALLCVLIKIPACLADVCIALVLFIEGKRMFGSARALGAAALYFLSPLPLYNSAYWGQVDSIHSLLILLALVSADRRFLAPAVVPTRDMDGPCRNVRRRGSVGLLRFGGGACGHG